MDLSHYFEGTFLCGYEGDNKLYEKETNIVIQNSQLLSDYSEYYTEYNIYLSGLKVGYYLTAHDASGGSLGSASYYCLYDGQGNIVQISNKIGDLPYYLFKYDTYGNTLETQTNGEDPEPAGYKGYSESAIYFKTGARNYDPNTGTFMTPDPFKGYMGDPASQHPYMYCAGNPIKYSDPSGYDYLRFDGIRLYWMSDNNKVLKSWKANSGQSFPTDPSKQRLKNEGPTIEGDYTISGLRIDSRVNHQKPDKTYGDENAWGQKEYY